MILLIVIKTLLEQFDEGNCLDDIKDIFILFLLCFLSILALPGIIIGDIIFIPIEIIIFLLRKHRKENKYNEKYTLKNFIDEI